MLTGHTVPTVKGSRGDSHLWEHLIQTRARSDWPDQKKTLGIMTLKVVTTVTCVQGFSFVLYTYISALLKARNFLQDLAKKEVWISAKEHLVQGYNQGHNRVPTPVSHLQTRALIPFGKV